MKTQKKNNEKIQVDLKDVVDLNINIVASNGLPAIQFKKVISACDKNMPYIKNILKKTLNEQDDVYMLTRIQIFNKPLAKGKIQQAGINLD